MVNVYCVSHRNASQRISSPVPNVSDILNYIISFCINFVSSGYLMIRFWFLASQVAHTYHFHALNWMHGSETAARNERFFSIYSRYCAYNTFHSVEVKNEMQHQNGKYKIRKSNLLLLIFKKVFSHSHSAIHLFLIITHCRCGRGAIRFLALAIWINDFNVRKWHTKIVSLST